MFRFTKKPSSGSHNQYLAEITSLVQCIYRRRTDVVSAMAAYYDLCDVCVMHCASVYVCTVYNQHTIICRHSTDVCTTSIYTLNQACNFS